MRTWRLALPTTLSAACPSTSDCCFAWVASEATEKWACSSSQGRRHKGITFAPSPRSFWRWPRCERSNRTWLALSFASSPPNFPKIPCLCANSRFSIDRLSEQKLQAELHNPRRPGAGHFADAEIVRIPATGAAPRRSAVIVGSPAATGVNRFPLGVIEGIESLPPELQGGVFGMEPRQLKVLQQRHVPVIAAGTD